MYQDCTLIIRVIQYLIQKNVEVLSRCSLSYGTINSKCTLYTILRNAIHKVVVTSGLRSLKTT